MENSPLGAETTREIPSYPPGTNPRGIRWDKVDSAFMLRPNNYNYFMVIARYMWEGVKNYRDVARTIPRLDIPEGERKFLAKSLVNTRMYEYGFFGALYYRLGEGVDYTREVIKATGDYFFFLRVLDDIVDGHITDHKVDRKVAKSLARACKDYLVGVYDESEFKNNLPSCLGSEGLFEVTKITKKSIPSEPDQQFCDDFSDCVKGYLNENRYGDSKGYEENLRLFAGCYQLIALDIVSQYPDFSSKDCENIRQFSSDLGIFLQLINDLESLDKGIGEEETRQLFNSYKKRLKGHGERDPKIGYFIRGLKEGVLLRKFIGASIYRNARGLLI